MKLLRLLFILPYFLLPLQSRCDPVITFFLRAYPDQKPAQKLKKPGNLARYRTETILARTGVAGIFSTYAGFIQASNYIGQTTFIRKYEKPSLELIITPRIEPIVMSNQLVHHWEIPEGTPFARYTVQQKQDKDTTVFYWEVTNNHTPTTVVPLDALLVLVKPTTVYVPEGITITQKSPNLVLPTLYVNKSVNLIGQSLYLINMMHFFAQLQTTYQQSGIKILEQKEE